MKNVQREKSVVHQNCHLDGQREMDKGSSHFSIAYIFFSVLALIMVFVHTVKLLTVRTLSCLEVGAEEYSI